MSLLPLERPMFYDSTEDVECYSPEQTQSYGRYCREDALEESAIEAEKNARLFLGNAAWTFFALAEKIRSLK